MTPVVLEYQPFPVEALPSIVRELAVETGSSVDCDVAFGVLPALTVAGAAIGNAAVVCPKPGFREPPLLWVCAVGDSGTGKSPAMKPATSAAFAINTRLRESFDIRQAEYLACVEAWKAQSKEERNQDEKPEPPTREHFAVIDATIERLVEMMGSSPRGVLIVRDELSGWFGSFTRYKGKAGGSDVPNWLSMYDAGPVSYHRRTGEPRDVEADRGFVAVVGGIQTDVLRQQLSDPAYLASGLAARLLFCTPPKACPRWTDAESSERALGNFVKLLDTLRAIPFDPKNGPALVRLTHEARARFKALNNEFAADAENRDGGPMAAAIPKTLRYALRLALIHHCVTAAATGADPIQTTLGEESMAAGETMARWFLHEAERVYAMLAERPEDRAARVLAEWVRRKGGRVRPRDLQRSNARRYPNAEAAELALDGLVSAAFGEWVDEPPGPKGGQPSRVFVLRSRSDARHNPTEPIPDRHAPGRGHIRHNLLAMPEIHVLPEQNGVVSGSVGCRTVPPSGEGAMQGEGLPQEVASDAPTLPASRFDDLLARLVREYGEEEMERIHREAQNRLERRTPAESSLEGNMPKPRLRMGVTPMTPEQELPEQPLP